MEDVPIRRRRPVTYGRTFRKRCSDIDDIFSSPTTPSSATQPAPPPSPLSPPLACLTTSAAAPETTTNSSTVRAIKSARRTVATAATTTTTITAESHKFKDIKLSAAPQPKPAPPHTADSDSSNPEKEEESEGYSDQARAATAQLFNEELLSHRTVFDVPSSDDEDPSPAPPLKRKRAPPARKPATTIDGPPAHRQQHHRHPESEDIPTKTKRSRLTRKPEVVATKLTSATNRSAPPPPPKGKAKAPKPTPARKPADPTAGLLRQEFAPPRPRVTRSQSRQLSEEPPAVRKESFRDRALRTTKIEVVIPASPRGKAAPSPAASQRKQEQDPTIPPDLKAIPEEESPPRPKPSPLLGKPRMADRNTSPPVVKPHKRPADSASTVQARPRKMSRSPTASDASHRTSQGTDIYGFRSQSQSQSLSQEQQPSHSQEVKAVSVQRQVPGNGKAGPRITYARERSYRMEQASDSLESMLNVPLPPIAPARPAKRRLGHLKPALRRGTSGSGGSGSGGGGGGGGSGGDDQEDGLRSKGGIKSIHELRAAGEHNRFIDDVEDLFLDIEGSCGLGTKRSGYFELTNRLRDKSFKQKFRSNSFDERLLTKMEVQTDEIITFVLAYLALCFLHEDPTSRIMVQVCNNGVVPMLARMLASARDISIIAKDGKTNMSKAALIQVDNLRTSLEKNPTFQGGKAQVISPQILALKVLEKLVRRFRECGNADEILDGPALRGLVDILGPFAACKEYPKTLRTHGFQLLELPISTLEAYTLGGYCSLEGQLSSDELVSLTKLFSVISGWTTDEDLGPLLLLLLRLNINISNNRPMACETLADPPFITSLVGLIKKKFEALSGTLEKQERLLSIDLLVLSLGLMTNFAEFSPKARAVVADWVVPSIEGSPLAVDVLLDTFLSRLGRVEDVRAFVLPLMLRTLILEMQADSMEESHTNVAFGYLAVLLGDLCQEDHIRYKARAKLPNCSLKPLLSAVEEFVAHHRVVDSQQDEPVQPDPQAEFTTRLQGVVVRLRAYE